MKLNLGCGDKKRDGYVNVDICGSPDVLYDLSQFPWPFGDGSIKEVFSEHFLEHVSDFEATILEIHRILAPDGILHFKVPHFRSSFYPWHLHNYAFSTVTCMLLCEKRPYQYGGRRLFSPLSLKLNFIYLRSFWARIVSKFANLCPGKWKYLGLPIDEIEFTAKKVVE